MSSSSSSTFESIPPNYLGPQVSFPTYIAFLSQLIPLQRSLLLLNLQKAHYFYSIEEKERLALLGWAAAPTTKNEPILQKKPDESDEDFVKREKGYGEEQRKSFESGGELKDVEGLLKECGLWNIVTDKEEEADSELANWAKQQQAQQANQRDEFQVVQIGGVPFLLHLPAAYLNTPHGPPSPAFYKSWKRSQAILHILTTMLQLLITYQPSAPAIAYGRALLRTPLGAGTTPAGGAPAHNHHHHHNAAAGGAAAALLGPPPPVPAQRRRATISIVINLEAMIAILIPLILLSIKLAFLLWIFGRHASSTKRMILFGMAVAYVIWEGWTMQRRRAGAGRDRVDREIRRRGGAPPPRPAAGGGGDGAAPGQQQAQPQQPGQPQLRRRGPAPAPGAPGAVPVGNDPNNRPTPRVREPTSRFTPRYWINWIAAIGLAEEARELGLVPRSIAGRPVVNPPVGTRENRQKRALRTALVAIVLFFGTLSPEVEKKRKRALEKREKLLTQRKAARERRKVVAVVEGLRAAAAAEGGRSGNSTPGLVEVEADASPELKVETEESLQDALRAEREARIRDLLESTELAGEPQAGTSSSSTPPLHLPVPETTPDVDSSSQDAPPLSPSSPSPTIIEHPPEAGNAPLMGRALISDAELFADGLGEPDQDEQAVVEGRVEDNETDEEGAEDGEGEADVDAIVALF